MKLKKFLTIRSNGLCRITANKPYLDSEEIAIQLNLEIPVAIFYKPSLEANIVIDESAIGPEKICDDVLINTKDAIEKATGLIFNIEVVRNLPDE